MDAFNRGDFDTRTWRLLARRMDSMLAKDRAELESGALDDKPNSSVRLRARIKLIRELLAIPAEVEKAQQEASANPAHTNP